jgi:predicted DNA-binding protein YlxM (UPF0122 family)
MMNEILEKSLLYDFYGELLTPRQKDIYEQYILEDLSLSEIAANQGISRQGIHDLVRRCEKILEGYENKLQLVKRFLSIRNNVREIEDLFADYNKEDEMNVEELISKVRKLSTEILEQL